MELYPDLKLLRVEQLHPVVEFMEESYKLQDITPLQDKTIKDYEHLIDMLDHYIKNYLIHDKWLNNGLLWYCWHARKEEDIRDIQRTFQSKGWLIT